MVCIFTDYTELHQVLYLIYDLGHLSDDDDDKERYEESFEVLGIGLDHGDGAHFVVLDLFKHHLVVELQEEYA